MLCPDSHEALVSFLSAGQSIGSFHLGLEGQGLIETVREVILPHYATHYYSNVLYLASDGRYRTTGPITVTVPDWAGDPPYTRKESDGYWRIYCRGATAHPSDPLHAGWRFYGHPQGSTVAVRGINDPYLNFFDYSVTPPDPPKKFRAEIFSPKHGGALVYQVESPNPITIEAQCGCVYSSQIQCGSILGEFCCVDCGRISSRWEGLAGRIKNLEELL